ncbi:hypothetical protein VT85_18255 [Planctomyces sp. SH-PL62]|nr:hypothetical protein VT85_18255 [Planctomyces sp. SH-PL62]
MAAGVWLVAVILAVGWLRGRAPAQLLLVATAAELGALYYTSTTDWGWAVAIPESSPILTRLAQEKDVGKVAGLLSDIPLRLGMAPIFPYTGFEAPPPHPSLAAMAQRGALSHINGFDFSYYGATHGVWDENDRIVPDFAETLLVGRDEALDRLIHKPAGAPAHATWRLVRFKKPAPRIRAYVHPPYLRNERQRSLASELPPRDQTPRATLAEVTSWDGRTATVDHDGSCDVVLVRTYYPGWTYRIDDGPERPVADVERGVQAAHVPGAGVHRVTFAYRPTYRTSTIVASAGALLLALATLVREKTRRSPPRKTDADRQDDRAEQHGLGGGRESGGEPREA